MYRPTSTYLKPARAALRGAAAKTGGLKPSRSSASRGSSSASSPENLFTLALLARVLRRRPSSALWSLGRGMSVSVGQKAPDFTLRDEENQPVTLSSFRGAKSVVLFFYPKDFTSGCTKQACLFRDSMAAFNSLHAEVLGISSDSVASHKSFKEQHGLNFRLLADEGSKVRSEYGATQAFGLIPARLTYVVDKQGEVKHSFQAMMDVATHVTEAKKALEQLNEK